MQESFQKAKTWVKELQRQASPNIVMALAGNKADMSNKRQVDYEEAQVCVAGWVGGGGNWERCNKVGEGCIQASKLYRVGCRRTRMRMDCCSWRLQRRRHRM